MPIRGFELFHGAVLAKLVRNDRPVTLRLIETNSSVAWASYTINDEVTILVKYRSEPYKHTRAAGAASWQFVFSADEVSKIQSGKVWVALVCGARKSGRDMEVCLMDPDQLTRVLPQSNAPSLTVKSMPRKMLRVSSVRGDDLLIARSRLETWEIPGS